LPTNNVGNRWHRDDAAAVLATWLALSRSPDLAALQNMPGIAMGLRAGEVLPLLLSRYTRRLSPAARLPLHLGWETLCCTAMTAYAACTGEPGVCATQTIIRIPSLTLTRDSRGRRQTFTRGELAGRSFRVPAVAH
jgi:hypothetical protein